MPGPRDVSVSWTDWCTSLWGILAVATVCNFPPCIPFGITGSTGAGLGVAVGVGVGLGVGVAVGVGVGLGVGIGVGAGVGLGA